MDFAKTHLESGNDDISPHKKHLSLEARHSKAIESARKIRSTLKSSIFIPKLPQKSLKFPWISIAKPAKSLPFPAKPNHNPTTLVKTTQTIENTKISGTLQRVKRKLQCNRIKTEITNKSKPRIIEAYRKQLRKVNVNGIKTKMKQPTKKCIEKSQDVSESIDEDEIEDTLRNMGLEVSITEGMEVISISEEKAKQVDDKTNDTEVIDLDSSADPLDISTVDLCCEDADEEMPHENSNIDNNSQNSSSEIIDMVSSEDQATTEERAMASSQKRANKLHTNLNESQEDTHQMEVIGMEGPEDQTNNVIKQDINYIKDKSVCLGEAVVLDSLKIQTVAPKEELHQPSALKVPPFSNYQTISPIQTDISQNIYSYNESLNEVREFQDLLKPYNDGSFASCIDEGILRDLRGIQDSVNDFAIFLHRTYMDIEDFDLEQRQVFEKFAAANQQNSNVPAEVVVKIDVPEMPRQILKFRATDIMQCSLEHFEKTQAKESQPPPQTRAPEDVSPSSACNKQYHVTPRNHGNHPEIGQRSGALINQEQVHTRNQYMNNCQIGGLVNNVHPVYRNEMRSTYQTASNEKSPAINPVHQPQTYHVYRAYQHTAQPYAPATSYIPKPQANLTLHIPQSHRNEMVTSETTLAPRNQFVSEHHHHQPVIQMTQDSPSTNITPNIQDKSSMSANQNQAGHNQNQRIQQTITNQEANPSNSSHANIPLSSTHQSPISGGNQQTHHSPQIYPSPHRHLGLSMPLLQSSSVPTHHPRSNLPPCNSNLHTYADQTREDDCHQARVEHLQAPQTQSQNEKSIRTVSDEAIPEHMSSDISRTTQVPDQTVHPNNSPDDSLKVEKSKGRKLFLTKTLKRALDQDRVADLNVIQTTPVSRKRGPISTNTAEPKAKRKYVKRKRPENEKASPDQKCIETSTNMQRDCEQVIRPTVINRCPRLGEEVACSEALSNQARSLNDNENSPVPNSHVRQSPPRTMSPAKTRSSDNSLLEKPASHTPPADYISIPQQTVNNCQSTDTRTSHPTQCTDPPQVNKDTSSIITPRPTGDTRLKDFRMRPPAPTQSALRDQVVNSSYPSIKNPPINREHTEYQKPPEKLSPPGPSPQNAQIKELLMKPPLIPQPTPPHFTHQSAHNNDHQHIHVADQMHHVNSYHGQTRELVQDQPRPPPPPYTMPPNYVPIPHPSTVLHQQQAWFPRPPNLLQQTTRPSHPYPNQYYPSNNNHYSPLVIAPNPLLTPPQSLDRQSSPLYRPLPYFPSATGYDPTVGIPMTPPSEDLVRPDTINQNATMLTASIGVYNQDANRQYFFKEMEYPPGQTVGPWRNAALAMPGVYPN